jgi:hypothetical protein
MAECQLDLVTRRLDDLRRVHPSEIRGDGARIDPGHFQNVLKEPVQPLDLRENQVTLLASIGVREP